MATTTERPDLDALGFTPEQARRWNAIADRLENVSEYYVNQFVGRSEAVFTHFTDPEARDSLLAMWEKARTASDAYDLEDMWDMLAAKGARFSPAQRELALFASRLGRSQASSVSRKADSFLDGLDPGAYATVLGRAASLASHKPDDGVSYFTQAPELYATLDEAQNERLYAMGAAYEDPESWRGRGRFFSAASHAFKAVEADAREEVLAKAESYFAASKPLALSFIDASGDVRPLIGKDAAKAWAEAADTFADPKLRQKYFEDSYSVFRQVRRPERVIGLVRDAAARSEALAGAVLREGFYVEDAKDDALAAWLEAGAAYHDPAGFAAKTSRVMAEADARTISELGEAARRIAQRDRSIADRLLDRSQSLVRSCTADERTNLYALAGHAAGEGELDAAREVVSSSGTFKGRTLDDLKRWLTVGRSLDADLRPTYYSHSSDLLDQLGQPSIGDWAATANAFARQQPAYKFFESSAKVLPFLAGKDAARAYELTRELAAQDTLAAVEFFSHLPETYRPGDTASLEAWARGGVELAAKRRSEDESAGERYFAHTAGIVDVLGSDGFDRWKAVVLGVDGKDARSAVLTYSRDELASLDKDAQGRYLGAVAEMAGSSERLVETVVKKGAAFAKALSSDELAAFNALARRIDAVTHADEYAAYELDPARLAAASDRMGAIGLASLAADQKRAGLARAVLENAKALEGLDARTARELVLQGATLYSDTYSESYYPDVLSKEAYGSFVRLAPTFAAGPMADYLMWKREASAIDGRRDKEEFIQNSERFFREVKPEDRERFLDYHAKVFAASQTAAIADLAELGRLSKLHDVAKDLVLHLGERIAKDHTSELHGYLRNTVSSLEAVKDPRELAEVYRAEQLAEEADLRLGKAFIEHFGPVLKEFDARVLSDWVSKGLAIYKQQGVEAAETYFKLGLTRSFVDELKERYHYVAFDDVSGAAGRWVGGVLGDHVGVAQVEGDKIAYTDNKSIFIPKRIDVYTDNETNRMLYWGLFDHEMAHIKYGSFDVPIEEALKAYEKPALAKHINNLLEDGRIEKRLRGEYGGLISRELDLVNETYIMKPLDAMSAMDPGQAFMSALLQRVKMGRAVTEVELQYQAPLDECYGIYKTDCEPYDVKGTWVATRKVYDIVTKLFPELTEPQDQQPGDDVGDNGNNGEGQGGGGQQGGQPQPGNQQGGGGQQGGKPDQQKPGDQQGGNGQGDDQQGGQPQQPGQQQGGGQGNGNGHDQPYDPNQSGGGTPTNRDEVVAEYKYDEWDSVLRDYLYEFTTVKEIVREKATTQFFQDTLNTYGDLRREIIEMMQSLKPSHLQHERRLPDGSEVDMDAYTDAWAERRSGSTTMDEDLFEETRKLGRDVAVVILVDQSGSTSGEVLKKEKESMVLMSEALQDLGDQFAIYGFDSSGKDDVRVYRVKGMDEGYDDVTKGRIEAMEAGSMTRMGPAVRHAMSVLEQSDARTKLFIYLTDGEPNDYGDSPNNKGSSWGGGGNEYVFADIRKAIEEGEVKGVKSYAVTIDSRADTYLGQMFGDRKYTVISDIEQLPRKLAEFYREVSDTTG